jgi:hypothetical protein
MVPCREGREGECRPVSSVGLPAALLAFDAARVLVMPLLLNCSRRFLALETRRRDMAGDVTVVTVRWGRRRGRGSQEMCGVCCSMRRGDEG